MSQNKNSENQQNQQQDQIPEGVPSMSFPVYVTITGMFGGLIWGIVGYVAFILNFIRVGPAMALMPWALGPWKETWIGQIVGILVISLISIGVAFLYRLLFVKINSIWPGLLFGAGLWIIVFGLLNPMFPGLKSLFNLDINTIITSACIYVVYGLFIGYSISYEYQEQQDERAQQSIQS
ncbi:YqhR family membrane protein [Texcoconibacillus texcoconensis]|uniref:Phosphoglycerol transferase MdoB-like AlkP superfamily enzyme n=1 Tax=Texcoconibacillus texcoconensis TaxID=1095777 RepID=A0A840QP08_9BACI|nr:YqhR family membrane protein [Texcoconibacillus texcoconensis]MBB5173088.1 phosphoglycerol transferase MdoB-like AlkP superfamily enzyme [Texcoconibacillus texcoconensis]